MSLSTERLTTALSDRYRIERELGQGGMATVYLAADLKHDRKVAIKVLKPELAAVLGAERFVQEIKTTAALSHPHILPLFDSGEAGGFLYYVMPYIEGETIRDRLNREGQFGIEEAVKITAEVADALDYAHRHGVIHRDIKPENILLHDGRPMVMDFGIALAVSAAAGGRMTETGLSLGTPHYMSPEQATADKQITARSDVYSLASVLYEMLAGEPPHSGGTAQAIIMKIIAERSKPVTELRASVPPNVAAALGKALEKVPADRFDSAKAFAEALASPTFTTATATAGDAGARANPRTRMLLAGLGTVAVLSTSIAAWALLRPEPPRPVIRYAVPLPPDRGLNAGNFPFDLAPDGSWLVYVGPAAGTGQNLLWVKARERLEATPLPGTEGARSPTISPDGKWIAFYADGALRRIAAAGGAATTIVTSVFPGIGGIWLNDGDLLYMDVLARLQRVPVAGGVSEVVVQAAGPNRGFVPVRALPDDRGFLFLACDPGCQSVRELWVADSRSHETKLLVADSYWGAYAGGQLIYTQAGGGLYVAPFDLRTLALRGEAIPVATAGGARNITLSASGTMAYSVGAGTFTGRNEAAWVTRDGRAESVDTAWTLPLNTNGSLALSPDGSRLAVSFDNDVWIKDLDRGPLSRLTFSDSSDTRARWTPDGRSVTFLSNRSGSTSVYRRRADGTGADSLQLTLDPGILEAETSRDGRWLVIRKGGFADHSRDILALRVGQDSAPRPLLTAPYDEEQAALSPDGRWLAYVSNETGRYEVFVRPFPDVDSGKWQVSTSGGRSPVWARSGRELFFINGDRAMVSQAVMPGAAFQRGEQRPLFSVAGYGLFDNYASFDVSPDDRRFIMVRQKTRSVEEPTVLVVTENWLTEVERLVKEHR